MADTTAKAALIELLSLECRVCIYGTVRYYNEQGQLHRVYGPAIEHPGGYRAWYQNGQLHRLDGPAIEYTDGSRAWFQTGRRHRIDGPAIEYEGGSRKWYINGKELTKAERRQQEAASMATA